LPSPRCVVVSGPKAHKSVWRSCPCLEALQRCVGRKAPSQICSKVRPSHWVQCPPKRSTFSRRRRDLPRRCRGNSLGARRIQVPVISCHLQPILRYIEPRRDGHAAKRPLLLRTHARRRCIKAEVLFTASSAVLANLLATRMAGTRPRQRNCVVRLETSGRKSAGVRKPDGTVHFGTSIAGSGPAWQSISAPRHSKFKLSAPGWPRRLLCLPVLFFRRGDGHRQR
jgi:hypothetical protein